MKREPILLARGDVITDHHGHIVGRMYYSGADEMTLFREWFDELTIGETPEEWFKDAKTVKRQVHK